ncbi:MAG: hypothetical protein HYX63_00030 [Gammaproteobacteria bacterium]|nr:hypothetical protein [Gammaproteobacteria bacterium]
MTELIRPVARRCVADTASVYGLLDAITLIQPHARRVDAEEFQALKRPVAEDQTATLTGDDGSGRVV